MHQPDDDCCFPAAIPPARHKSNSTGTTKVFRTVSVNSTSTTMSDIQDNLGSFKGPQHMVYHWGGGVTNPTELPLPQNDADIIQVSSGRTLKAGVTGKGRMVIWESSKNTMTSSSVGSSASNLWVPRPLEGQSGIVIVQVSCGDLFAACLTGKFGAALFQPLHSQAQKVHSPNLSKRNVQMR